MQAKFLTVVPIHLGAALKDNGSGLFLGGVVTSGSREVDFNAVTARLNLKWGG